MTEYKNKVIEHALLLEAEAWAKEIKQVHTFDSDSNNMAYDYPNPTREGYVTDTTYNDGRVQRLSLIHIRRSRRSTQSRSRWSPYH